MMDRDRPIRICFVAHNAYGELAGVDNGHLGGIEHQQALMARWLARRGHHVQMITWNEGQPGGEVIDGVRMHAMCRRGDGARVLRFLHPRWTSLWSAMRRADADVYYYNCGDLALGQVAMWCRRHRRKCVYTIANDPDCDPRLPVLRPLRERMLYRYGLRRADRVVTQTRRQQQQLRDGFGIGATVIPMPCEDVTEAGYVPPRVPTPQTARVLWVGRISEQKRLEWLLDAAERCPELPFDVVGAANSGSSYDQALTERARQLSNVVMHGRVPRPRMAEVYRRASVLCCTSRFEGFPNTFLEAWSRGIPIVSTYDPDDVIADRKLGWVARDVGELAAMLNEAIASSEEWSTASAHARRYVLENHTVQASMTRFERVFEEVVGEGVRRPHCAAR